MVRFDFQRACASVDDVADIKNDQGPAEPSCAQYHVERFQRFAIEMKSILQ